MSDHDWARVAAIRAALDAGRAIDPAELYRRNILRLCCDACGARPAQRPRVFAMTPQLRLWLWAAGDRMLMPMAA